MATSGFLWKRVSLTLFLFLCSCSKPCSQWQNERAVTCCESQNSSRLMRCSSNRFRGLELEIARGCSGMRMYLNVHSLCFPCDETTPPKTTVHITSGQESYDVWADRLEGGQRLLLPPEAAQSIICHLLNGNTVSLSAGRFKEEISPEGFCAAYRLSH